MKNPTTSRSPRPRLALGAAAVLAVIALGACEYSEVDGIGTRTADDEFPPQADLAAFDGCTPTDIGQWEAQGEVVNNTPKVSTYEVTVAFYDADDTRLAERSQWIRDLKPGESADLTRSWWIEDGERAVDCQLLTINRFG